MRIEKRQLSQTGHKYYRFFFKNASSSDYLISGRIIHKPNANIEDGIFFADEDHILKWITHGDALVEVLFDPSHQLYGQLPDHYFVENDKYSGNAILTGNYFDINSIEMYEFICQHWDIVDDFQTLQRHLIFTKAFDTLKLLWEYKYSVLGDSDREYDMSEAIILMRTYALKNNSENAHIILCCEDFDTLIGYINS